MKFSKNLVTLRDGKDWGNFALIVILWLIIGVGGLFTIFAIGRYLMATHLVLGEIFGSSILVISLIELYYYRISELIDDGKEYYNH